MAICVDFTKEEEAVVRGFAASHSVSVEYMIKQAVFAWMEDTYDAEVADVAYDEYVKEGCKSRPVSELWEELGL